MSKLFIFLLGLALSGSSLHAQGLSLDELLQRVEANNKSLAAYRSYIKGQTLQFKLENRLPNPDASAFYLPFGDQNTGDYSEFQISQRLEFPTVYAARSNWIAEQQKSLEFQYLELRQSILLKAQKLGLELIYLQKQRERVQMRVDQSNKVLEQVQVLYSKGQTGILDLNKVKIVWLDQQFALEDLETREIIVNRELQALNGGAEIAFRMKAYPNTVEIPSSDSLWNSRLRQDAQIALLDQEMQVAEKRLKLERNLLLPDLTAGYNYQGVAGSNYSGFYGGISIPLWSGRNKVKMAEAQIKYYDQQQSDALSTLKSEYTSQVQRYHLLLKKFKEYQIVLGDLDSEMLLQKSYELGEISFMDYYGEVSFYREAENRFLQIEKELQQLRSELFKHQL